APEAPAPAPEAVPFDALSAPAPVEPVSVPVPVEGRQSAVIAAANWDVAPAPAPGEPQMWSLGLDAAPLQPAPVAPPLPPVAPEPVPAPAPAAVAAPAADPLAAPAPAEVPHLASPDNLPPGTAPLPQGPKQGPNVTYLKEIWHAIQTQEISGSDALLALTQRPLTANDTRTPIPVGAMPPAGAPVPDAAVPGAPAPLAAPPAPADAAAAPLPAPGAPAPAPVLPPA
ncbi:hypothetical protein BST38_02615, partial [Mycolicibacterium parafortuitum]